MLWPRLQENWQQLKDLLPAWRGGMVHVGRTPPLPERRDELVNHIQELAREEVVSQETPTCRNR